MKKLLGVMLLLVSTFTYADGFKTEKEMRQFSDSLIDKMVADKFQEGFNSVKPFWPLPTVEIDGIASQMSQQWPMIKNRFGVAIGKEFIKKERIGNSFVQYYYLHKFNNHAIYWKIAFYKPNNEWKINTITYLDNLDSLYE